MGSHRKNCAPEDEPQRGGKGVEGKPAAQGASSPDPEHAGQSLPHDVGPSLPHVDEEALERDAAASARVSGVSADAGAPLFSAALPPLDEIRPEHVAYVRALVSKLAVSPTYEREDLVQEVLIQAHRSKHSLLEARALLFGITRHVVYRWIASYQHEQAVLASHEHQAAEDDAHPSAEDEWQAAERRDVVRASIEELPDIFRDVFVRVEVEEMSMPEAAKALGIPINTGYTRLHLARARFSELLRRLLARRRIDKEDLALPVLLAGVSDGEDASRTTSVSTEPPAPPSPDAPPKPTLPRLPALRHLPHLPWGATELLLLGGAVAVSVAVSPPEARRPDVVAEPHIATTSATPSIAAPSVSDAPPLITPPPSDHPAPPDSSRASAPEPPSDSSRASAPDPPSAPSTVASTTVAPTAPPSPRPTSPAAPSSPSTIRSDGAWARDIAKLALAGDRAGAAAELAAFRKAYPNSTYITRLEAMVVSTPPRQATSAPTSEPPPPL